MTYLIVQMLLWLILALVLGALLGWVLRGKSAVAEATSLRGKTQELEIRLGQCEKERAVTAAKFRQSEALVLKRDESIAQLKSRLEGSGGEPKSGAAASAFSHSPRITALEADLKSCRRQRELLNEQIEERDNRISQLVSDLGAAAVGQPGSVTDPSIANAKPKKAAAKKKAAKKKAAAKSKPSQSAQDSLLLELGEPEEAVKPAKELDSNVSSAAKVTAAPAEKPEKKAPAPKKKAVAKAKPQQSPQDGAAAKVGDAEKAPASNATAAKMFDTAPAEVDDLKRLSGVGPKLEKMLNTMGIYQFKQIAEFDEGDIAWVDSKMTSFKGRISRDDWVGQAKKLLS